jgi:hypothetical protein
MNDNYFLTPQEKKILRDMRLTPEELRKLLEIKDEYCKPHHGKYCGDAEYA